MAMRKPTPDNARTRAIVKLLEKGPKEPTSKEKARPKTKSWDGADEEALAILAIADPWNGSHTRDERRKLIAARLRKIAQGPRKWGVLR